MRDLDDIRSLWVVGASSGIGRALVRQFDAPGRTIFVSARDGVALEELREELAARVVVLPLDIVDSEAVKKAAAVIDEHTAGLDLVVINAGTCEYIDANDIDTDLIERVMRTNFLAATQIVRCVLPLLRVSRRMRRDFSPMLVLVASSVTFQALPRAGAYGASKAALRYFAESLKIDLQHEAIDVRVVSPGFVKTPLTDRNDFSMPFLISADQAARRIMKGLTSSRFDIHFPRRFTWLLKLFACLPDSLRFNLLGKMSRHPSQIKKSAHRTE